MRSKLFILDTNVLISAFLTKESNSGNALNKAIELGKIVASEETLEELKEVLFRPKFDKYISAENRIAVFYDFKKLAIIIKPSVTIADCRDPKDNKFLELAVSVNAFCIITGDKDLQVLNPFRGIPILNPIAFIEKF